VRAAARRGSRRPVSSPLSLPTLTATRRRWTTSRAPCRARTGDYGAGDMLLYHRSAGLRRVMEHRLAHRQRHEPTRRRGLRRAQGSAHLLPHAGEQPLPADPRLEAASRRPAGDGAPYRPAGRISPVSRWRWPIAPCGTAPLMGSSIPARLRSWRDLPDGSWSPASQPWRSQALRAHAQHDDTEQSGSPQRWYRVQHASQDVLLHAPLLLLPRSH
jgi:hypothetical protein